VLGGGADVSEPLSEALSPSEPEERGSGRPGRSFAWKYWLIAPAVIAIRWLGSKRQHGVDVLRDSRELWLLEQARARGLPVLGICRGAQLMSVASGGTLVRGLDEMYEERARLYTVLPRRQVWLEAGSLMRRVLGRDVLHVNSLHHHAIQLAGEGLRVAAREPEGIVQAVERRVPALWWGVQWHPEYLPQSRAQLVLLRHWVAACASRVPATGEVGEIDRIPAGEKTNTLHD
jgi:putative glutamine amidotransferase